MYFMIKIVKMLVLISMILVLYIIEIIKLILLGSIIEKYMISIKNLELGS